MPKKRVSSQEPTKNKTNQDKPWDKSFEDDRDDNGNFSRIERRKHTRGNTVLTWVLVGALVLICLIPVVWHAVDARMANKGESNTRITVTSDKHSSSSKDNVSFKSSKSSKSSSTSSSAQSSKPASSSSSVRSSSSSQPASSSSSSRASSSSNSAAAGSYTVKSGDNLYRIAVNHGMTLSEIQALNGMGSSTSITPGQTLKVK